MDPINWTYSSLNLTMMDILTSLTTLFSYETNKANSDFLGLPNQTSGPSYFQEPLCSLVFPLPKIANILVKVQEEKFM